MLLIAHYYATRSAAKGVEQLVGLGDLGSVSQTRTPPPLTSLHLLFFLPAERRGGQAVGVVAASHRACPG